MPDALSKTVPIWCTVINLALRMRQEDVGQVVGGWDNNLYLPPNIVSPSEKAQIQALIPTWAAALDVSCACGIANLDFYTQHPIIV